MIDISRHISEVLYDHHSVALPGLGSFILAEKPASTDAVLGLLSPPSRQVDFNPLLALDDGLIATHLSGILRVTLEESTQLINTYTTHILTSLAQNELVVLPGIGKLYADFQGDLRFLPEHSNFDLRAYGLPDVRFYPIFRSRESAVLEALGTPHASTAAEIAVLPPPAPQKSRLAVRMPRLAIPSAAALFLIAGLSAWLWWNSTPGSGGHLFNRKVSQVRVNEKPTGPESDVGYEELPPVPIDPADNSSSDPANAEPKADDRYLDSEAAGSTPSVENKSMVPPAEQPSAVIILGSFRDKKNIRNIVARILDAGYDVYQEKLPNGLTRVGVQLGAGQHAELSRHLRQMQSKFNREAFILRPKKK